MNPKNAKNYQRIVKPSLNESLRARHQRQISIDNLGLFKRIQSKKSIYDYMKFNSYRGKMKKNYSNRIESQNSSYELGSFPNNNRKLSPLQLKNKDIASVRIQLDNQNFRIKIVQNKKKVTIFATNLESQEKFCLELKMKEALQIMKGKIDWNLLINSLHLDNGELALWEESFTAEIN